MDCSDIAGKRNFEFAAKNLLNTLEVNLVQLVDFQGTYKSKPLWLFFHFQGIDVA